MSGRRPIPIGIAGLLLIGACFRDESGPTAPNETSLSPVVDPNQPQTRDLVTTPRFDVRVDVAGSYRPGDPLAITAVVRGNLPTQLARIDIALPEVVAYLSPRATGEAPLETPLLPVLSARSPVARGQQLTFHSELTIATPGYYRVAVSAHPIEIDTVDPGLGIQGIGYTELWVYINDNRGRSTPRLDRSVFGADEYQLPGPRRARLASPADTIPNPSLRMDRRLAALALCTWKVKYADDNSVFWPVQNAEIRVSGSRAFTLRTDSFGRFTLCPGAGETFHFEVRLINPDVVVVPTSFAEVTGITSSTVAGDVIIASHESRIYENANRTVGEARALFTYSRSMLDFDYRPAEETSFYSTSNDGVVINSSAVWGERGIFVVADIFRTCQVEVFLFGVPAGYWAWKGEEGVDYMTYCFENRVDPAVTGSSVWFTTRGNADPRAYRETASESTGWSAANIRTNWRYNLYEKP